MPLAKHTMTQSQQDLSYEQQQTQNISPTENPNFIIYDSSTDESSLLTNSAENKPEGSVEPQGETSTRVGLSGTLQTTALSPAVSHNAVENQLESLPSESPSLKPNSDTRSLPNWQNFVIGAIAGSSQQLLSHPLEYVKTMKQFHNVSYSSIFRDIAAKPTRAWTGALVTCVCYSPRSAVRFTAYEYIYNNLGIHNAFLAGALSGIVEATTVATISETIKTKYMVSKESLWQALRREGFFAIYKGTTPMIAKQILNHSVRFGGTDRFIHWMTGGRKEEKQWYHVTTGAALSGLCSVVLTQPFDVLKSLQQSGDPRYKTLPLCIQTLKQAEGGLVKQFYRGASARVARVIMEVSLTFTFYDVIKRSVEHYLYGNDMGSSIAVSSRTKQEESL